MNLPQHIAIIMDGNGRWAKQRGMARTMGHQEGVETVRKITSEASRMGLKYLTLYAFSTENWNRPAPEVEALMKLMVEALEEEIFMKNNVKMQMLGDIDRLPDHVRQTMRHCEERTSKNTGLVLNIALSYSAKWEITEAVKTIARKVADGEIKTSDITEQTISDHLVTAGMPDPELLIRTGGELRISNYLLWQCAYAEMYFTDVLWPDFDEAEFHKAIDEFNRRERRFGKTSEQVTETSTI